MVSGTGTAAPLTIADVLQHMARDGDGAVKRLTGPWVMVGPPGEDQNGKEWSYRTLSARTVRVTINDVETVLNESYQVFPLQKPRTRAFANTLLLGRSSSNDVSVSHSSISKLHARMRQGDDNHLWLSDAGSSNGTYVDNVQLTGDAERRLDHGSVVRCGSWTLQVYDAERFTQMLKRFG